MCQKYIYTFQQQKSTYPWQILREIKESVFSALGKKKFGLLGKKKFT